MQSKKLKKLKKKDVSQVALYLISLVIFILGLSYASVPLYQLFCQATGFGGTIQTYESTIMMEKTNKLKNTSLEQNIQEMAREEGTKEKSNISSKLKPITIYFNADISEGEQEFPWKFKPTISQIQVYPGDTALTFFIANNTSSNAISGVSTYHVSPAKVGIYFNKIQCFCFEEQRLKPYESIEMPVLFFLDSDFIYDPKMQDVDSITLSYTFFPS